MYLLVTVPSKNLSSCGKCEQFLEVLNIYEQFVSNPNANIIAIFAYENHVKYLCKKLNFDFIVVRDSILKHKPLKYKDYISNWIQEY